MFEKTFYDLLNSILEMDNAEVISLLENYDNFLDSLLSNQELLNEIRTQMRLEGLSKTDMAGKKEELLADMRALAESAELEISNEKKELYNKPGCKGEVEIDKNNSDNCGSFYSVLPNRNDKRTAGFPRDEVSDLLTEIKWNQKGKKAYILKRSTQPDVWRRE